MKRKLTITSVILGLSVVAGSAYAASNTDMLEVTKSNFTSSTTTISIEEAMKSGDYTDYAQMAKDKGITVEELFEQLEKEGKMTKTVKSTEAVKSDNTVNLEEMAKEKGISVEQLIAQLEKEGKLTKAAATTEAMKVENTKGSMDFTNSSDSISLEEMAKEKGISVEKLIAQLEKEGKLTKAVELTESMTATPSNK